MVHVVCLFVVAVILSLTDSIIIIITLFVCGLYGGGDVTKCCERLKNRDEPGCDENARGIPLNKNLFERDKIV